MPEIAFLDAVQGFLAGPAGLVPAPGRVGFGVPEPGDAFPVLALALGRVGRVDLGLGGGAGGGSGSIMRGALPVTATIDLADPVLPGPGGFPLLVPPRLVLTLPHGGLVRSDGLDAPPGPADLSVTVAGTPRTLVAAAPGPLEFTADPTIGQLTFGAPLPPAGLLVASYRIGVWERFTTRLEGELLLSAWDTDTPRLLAAGNAALRALAAAAGGALPGLRRIGLLALGPVGERQAVAPQARERVARLGFAFDHVRDVPASSGGIIRRVPVTSRLVTLAADPVTGAPVETIDTETDD